MKTDGNDKTEVQNPSLNHPGNGLTKREHFAIEIAKALESRAGETSYSTSWEDAEVADRAVRIADLLIRKLNGEEILEEE